MALTAGAECPLHTLALLGRPRVAPDPGEHLRQLDEVLGAKVSLAGRQHDEGVRLGQARPGPGERGYGAIGALDPDPVTVPAGPLGDQSELLAEQRMEGVRDADPSCRSSGTGCSRRCG